ncbi:DNA primase large subunit-like [Procambarus clarkii]|uniref:DNA primase large subunit-like n=1 Tax=Procambarus clarkii TaxID=6728 RepID=UPI0037436B16
MEFGGRRIRKNRRIEIELSYPSTLQFYSSPPSGNVSLAEFDEMAVERLKILRCVERLNLSGHIKNSDDWMNKLYDEFAKHKYFIHTAEKISSNKRDEVEAARRRDHVSHFVLRLAYCRTEDLRRWFIAHETDLFRARFIHCSKNGTDIKNFMMSNNLHFTPITSEEVQNERENLIAGTYNISSGDMLEGRIFYKVPFIEALELVRQRKIYLNGGYAYVPDTDLVTLVTASFRSNLSHALATTNRALPQLEDDERLMKLLQDFDKRYTGNDYSQKKNSENLRITPDMIDQLASKSFPLCMRQLNDTLRTTHHLRHGGRLSYGLFLKAAGLSLEDALYFWRSHFTKTMDVDKFEKQYAYNIRFNYGKEGKRTDYTPYSCLKIIMTSIGSGDAHGCPFKHTDAPILKQRLTSFQVPQQAINEIMELVSKNHYQIACQRYWEATHNSQMEAGINHPNQYFEESYKVLHGLSQSSQAKKTPQVRMNRSVMYSSQSLSQPTQMSSQSTQGSTQDDTTPADMDSTMFDDDMDSAMLEQYMETSKA